MKQHDTTETRGRGRPPLPPGEARDGRVSVRLDGDDAAMLARLAEALDTSESEAMRLAMRALFARKVR